jgi:hypothetical protein
MVEKIRQLCKQRGTNFKNTELALGFANGSLAKTNAHSEFDRFVKLSEYFDVPISFFSNSANRSEQYELEPIEKKLIDGYRAASAERKAIILNLASDALELKKEKSSSSRKEG